MSSELDTLDADKKLALICLDNPEHAQLIANSMTEFGVESQSATLERDILLALTNWNYDVLVIPETFRGGTLEKNGVLEEVAEMESTARRQQCVVLVGRSIKTNDYMKAFQLSVDGVINVSDLDNFKEFFQTIYLEKQQNLKLLKDIEETVHH